jgi:L-lactate dehydrogenase complex protein LldG
MNSRDSIFQSIKEAKLRATPRPSLEINHTTYKDNFKEFENALKSVGGVASVLGKDESLEDFIAKNYDDIIKIGTNLDISIPHTKINSVEDEHELKDIDLAIIKAKFGVAENGAVWVMEEDNLNRVIYFIAKKLLIITPKNEIVSTMHEAYKKIDFKNRSFGTFISGPSKTADIEQALVIGAHGAMECRVLFV